MSQRGKRRKKVKKELKMADNKKKVVKLISEWISRQNSESLELLPQYSTTSNAILCSTFTTVKGSTTFPVCLSSTNKYRFHLKASQQEQSCRRHSSTTPDLLLVAPCQHQQDVTSLLRCSTIKSHCYVLHKSFSRSYKPSGRGFNAGKQ